MIVDLLADLVLKKIHNHLVLSYSGAPYSIGGASSLQGARSSRLGAYIPSCSSHGQEADHIP